MKEDSSTSIGHSHELQKQIGPDFKTESASCYLGLTRGCTNDRYHDYKLQGLICIKVSIHIACMSHTSTRDGSQQKQKKKKSNSKNTNTVFTKEENLQVAKNIFLPTLILNEFQTLSVFGTLFILLESNTISFCPPMNSS